MNVQTLKKTMEVGTESEFMKQFVGSGAANMLTIGAVGLFWCARKLFSRNSRCKSKLHCCCLEVEVADKTLHEAPKITDESGPGFV
jgi:hypothetical protein